MAKISSESDHYQTLGLAASASSSEIKQAYRQLAKQYHPDTRTGDAGHAATASDHTASDHDEIAQINAAYEVLSDPNLKQAYDRQRRSTTTATAQARHQRTADVQNYYRQHRQREASTDQQLKTWLKQVYNPVDRLLSKHINGLKGEVRELSADPFDDELMENFQTYLEDCRTALDKSKQKFKSMPNPSNVAGVAANLYYCMNQFEDGIEEIERFTTTYDDSYLHTGQELFRIASKLRKEAKADLKVVV
ncbi:MAG: DnaJ domain-containing protein [Cyanobacteria bacterium P01_A01_bin.105]